MYLILVSCIYRQLLFLLLNILLTVMSEGVDTRSNTSTLHVLAASTNAVPTFEHLTAPSFYCGDEV